MEQKTLCQMAFTKDAEGKEMLVKDGSFQVMMEWERPYMQACVDALCPRGRVLEVGFGCGYAATHIQTYRPLNHTIIEYHPLIAQKAREWAKNHTNVTIIEDTWQNALGRLGCFDAIFFDDYPLESGEETNRLAKAIEGAPLLVQQGNELLRSIHETLPRLQTLTYQEEDIDFFIRSLSQIELPSPSSLLLFFSSLKQDDQITTESFAYAISRLQAEGLVDEASVEKYQQTQNTSKKAPSPKRDGRLFAFLTRCFENHMKPGSLFSCYLESSVSKFEDPLFLEQIITNPFIEYKERTMHVAVPPHCNYFKGDQALVITIEKLA